ncbi:ABC transporter permease subunit [Metabacillus herbersteinensis]|uniref:ABC transporter permease subunit n=1 Tax=Metabacillus herbersteinensis TaxID=283816 RepID=A0ABV6GMM7_9BACI
MVARELIVKELKQVKLQLILTSLIIGFFAPIGFWVDYMNYLRYEPSSSPGFVYSFDSSPYVFGFVLLVVTLAVTQMGFEKSRGTIDFTLGLPASRGSIFFTKWLIGVATILLSWVVSFLMMWILLTFTQSTAVHFLEFNFFLLPTMFMFYTLCMASGAITGTPFAQGLVVLSVSVLPILTVLLIMVNVAAFLHVSIGLSEIIWLYTSQVSPASYLTFDYLKTSDTVYVFPLLVIVISYLVGHISFVKHPNERNGYFFVWKWLNLPVQALVMLIGILGFSWFGYASGDESLLGYVVGALIGASTGFSLGYFLIYKKKKA